MLPDPGRRGVGRQHGVELGHHLVVALQIGRDRRPRPAAAPARPRAGGDRVLFERLEEERVEVAVEVFGVGFPAPPEVRRQSSQALDALRQRGSPRLVLPLSSRPRSCPSGYPRHSPRNAWRPDTTRFRVLRTGGAFVAPALSDHVKPIVGTYSHRLMTPARGHDEHVAGMPVGRRGADKATAASAARSPEAMQSGRPTPR